VTGSSASRFALLTAVVFASGCALSQGPPIAPTAKQAVAGRLVGPGPILTGKFGGPIFGWAIDENGTDGVLTEVTSISDPYTSVVETFDQTNAQIEKIVRKEKSGPEGNRELVVDAIAANDVSLIDGIIARPPKPRKNIFYTMAPATGNKITGKWTPPPGKNFLIWDIADQQVDPDSVMAATKIDGTITKPPTFEVIVTDIATNKVLRVLHAPNTDGVNYPYFVAEDMATHRAYVPAANYQSQTVFVDFDLRSGHLSNKFVAPPFSGPVMGMAIDSSTHMMCTTTAQNFSFQLYDLKTEQQTFVGQVPNAGGELQAPSSVAADSVNHLFLVEQPQSLLGGSEIYVYDEKGNLLESLSGFDFIEGSGIQVVPASRSGYADGPGANHLQSFTY
jgi:hypothetical protein